LDGHNSATLCCHVPGQALKYHPEIRAGEQGGEHADGKTVLWQASPFSGRAPVSLPNFAAGALCVSGRPQSCHASSTSAWACADFDFCLEYRLV
jgi:hypothetical protein